MSELQVFTHPEFGKVRAMALYGAPWLVGRDVAVALGYANPENAIAAHVDDDDKTTALIQGTGSNYKSKAVLINESGLYSLVHSSKLPGAKKFRKWVTGEVLPSIRKNGGYNQGQDEMTPIELLAKSVVVAQKLLDERDARIAALTVQAQIMAPKAEYFDKLVERNTLTSFREMANELGVKKKKFVSFLMDAGYIFRDENGQFQPCADKNDGLFEVREFFNAATKWSGTQTLITPKGRETFKLLCKGLA